MTEKTSPPKKTDKDAREIMAERKSEQKKTAPKKTNPEKYNNTNWSLRILLIVIIFLLGSGATIYFLPALKDRLPVLDKWVGAVPESKPDPLLTEKITALEKRLAGQDIDIQALKATSHVPPQTDPLLLERMSKLELAKDQKDDISQAARIDMMLSRMSQLEASFVPLSKSLAEAQEMRLERSNLAEIAATQTEKLDNIESRLNKVEEFTARDNNGALLVFRIGELRRKVTSGEAYGPEIDALSAMLSKGSLALNSQLTEALEWLNQHRDGVVTGGRLRDQFDEMIPSLIRAQSSYADDPWWQRAYNSTKNLIMVRKTENTAEDSTSDNLDNIITNAHRVLSRLDLKEALILLKQLPDNMREMLNVWIMQVEIYLRADDELDRIESIATGLYMESEKGEETGS